MIFDFKSFSRWLAVTAAISACATKIHGPTTADAFALRPVTSSSNARSLSRTATIGLPRTSTIASTSTTATQQQQQQQQPRPLTIMYRIRCENKYYQLEELEDADNCTTELFLKHDGTVDVMETDGPLFSKAVGNWEIKENQFAMTITKTFATGTNNKSDPTGMGEFTFAVERVFEGEMTVVGGDGGNDVKGHNGIPSEWVEPVAQQDAWLEEPQQQQQQQEWAEPQQQQEWAEPQQEWEQQQQQQQQQQQEWVDPQQQQQQEWGSGGNGAGYGQEEHGSNDPGPSFADYYAQQQPQQDYSQQQHPSFADYYAQQQPQQDYSQQQQQQTDQGNAGGGTTWDDYYKSPGGN
eukprot:CAMPEP_0168180682 /NCGR_PEP_ID=MMETSP0139_2-20121125/10695_1 /TAXON_ID=44445 /ORGANISM="Pseudo-nitzschia australis, Strain 10249 10 AB" /LENGTH=349 /DNA_ID=CAMNT_0008100971 /DNA_START=228 /DNA_END=1276 /DNA_ORIENTATION=-